MLLFQIHFPDYVINYCITELVSNYAMKMWFDTSTMVSIKASYWNICCSFPVNLSRVDYMEMFQDVESAISWGNRRRAEYGFGEYGFKHRAQWVFWPSPSSRKRAQRVALSPLFVCKATSPSFSQNSPSLPPNSVRLSEFSSPKRYSRNSIPAVSYNFPDYVIIFYIAELVSNYFLGYVNSCVVSEHAIWGSDYIYIYIFFFRVNLQVM